MVSVYLVWNSHIDPIWLWRWNEGQQVIRSTFASAVKLLKERKDFMFFASSAAFYKVIEDTDKELFREIQKLVKEGRWQIVGGWWIEPDCNLPSGESFVRQSLYGQRYFIEKFGVKAKVGYNIDSFGHNGMLPQILVKSGIKYYVFMRPSPNEKELPYWIFRWKSKDGSEVIAHRIILTYAASGKQIEDIFRKIVAEIKPPINALLFFLGRGDHGGGPTVEDLEVIEKIKRENKEVEIRVASLEEFFKEVEKSKESLPLVFDELQHHASGCYSAVSKIKELNRKVEEYLISAEKFNFIANCLTDLDYFDKEIRKAWINLLFCQFHDILAGTSIKEAYENDVFPMLYESLNIANNVINCSVQAIASKININANKSVVVFNPHVCSIKAPVELNWIGKDVPSNLQDDEGNIVECQVSRGPAVVGSSHYLSFVDKLPSLGYKVYRVVEKSSKNSGTLKTGEYFIENDWIKVEVNKDGTINLMVKDKSTNELIQNGAKAIVIEDKSDTWSHGVFRFDNVIGEFSCKEIKVVENGPIRATIRVKYKYGNSSMIQDFVLYKDLDYLICKISVDWHENMKMLKLEFPTNLNEPKVTYEIQYGTINRPNDGEEEPGLRWVDLTGKDKYGKTLGLAIINNSKYSYDVRGSSVRLTVLRSPPYAYHIPTKLEQGVDYEYTDQGQQSFMYIIKPHVGELNTSEIIKIADLLIVQPIAIIELAHEGKLPTVASLIEVPEENVVLKVVKKAEDSKDWILRLYETSGKATNVHIRFPMNKVEFEVNIKPYEIKTYLISLEKKLIKETNLIEEPIEESKSTVNY